MKAVLSVVCLLFATGSSSAHVVGGGCTQTRWSIVATRVGAPYGIAALSATDVWVAGATSEKGSAVPLISHWDGHRLSRFRPFARRGGPAVLYGIAAAGPSDVWVVGTNGAEPLIGHWNGHAWRRIAARGLQRGSYLFDVVALSPTTVWAVGAEDLPCEADCERPVSIRWNGSRWTPTQIERHGSLVSVAGSKRGLWAVGTQGGELTVNTEDGLAMRSTGGRWRTVPTPTPDDGDLGVETSDDFTDVSVIDSGLAWATHTRVERSDVMRWNGRRWRVVHVFPGRELLRVDAVSAREVWVAGGGAGPFVSRFDGRRWRDARDRTLKHARGFLRALDVDAGGQVWAAGPGLLVRSSC